MKYELMLRDILKHSDRAGLVQEIPTLQDAIYVMKVCLFLLLFLMQIWQKIKTF